MEYKGHPQTWLGTKATITCTDHTLFLIRVRLTEHFTQLSQQITMLFNKGKHTYIHRHILTKITCHCDTLWCFSQTFAPPESPVLIPSPNADLKKKKLEMFLIKGTLAATEDGMHRHRCTRSHTTHNCIFLYPLLLRGGPGWPLS